MQTPEQKKVSRQKYKDKMGVEEFNRRQREYYAKRVSEGYVAKRSVNQKPTRPELRRDWTLKRQYGITLDDLNNMLQEQGGKCAICTKAIVAIGTREANDSACVDHCHDTGKIRGLLCRSCNTAIGLLQDSPDVIRAAAYYLSLYK